MDHSPVIIEAAVNGVPTDGNPNRPVGDSAIAADALACLEAGAAIVHTHTDDFLPPAEAASHYAVQYQQVLARRPDAILYPTLTLGQSIEEKLGHHELLVESCGIRMGCFDPGSVNLTRPDDQGLPRASRRGAYVNSPYDVSYAFELFDRLGVGTSMAIYEPTFLRYVLAYSRAGKLPRGSLAKLYFGADYGTVGAARYALGFGLPPTRPSLDAYLAVLEGSGVAWGVAVLGGDVFANGFARYALERGGHLRVGLEDYVGERQPSNVDLVEEAVKLSAAAGRPVATTAEAARILDLPR